MNDETPYSNREIREFNKEIKTQLDRIEIQTLKTNGRVTNLEKWRSYQNGATAVFVIIVLPSLGFLAVEVIRLLEAVKIL